MSRDELLRAWVAALESGKYQQAQYALRRGDGYCCLGVVCDLSHAGSWVDNVGRHHVDDGSHLYGIPGSYVAQECGLPRAISRVLGIDTGKERLLWEANDLAQETFPQIAQRIRNWFPDVFPVAA